MKKAHFEAYLAHAWELAVTETDAATGEILTGVLTARQKPARQVAIRAGIPRFVDSDNYADNFGLQWKTWRQTQLDSHSGLPLTTNRFWQYTKWQPGDLRGKTVLEVGSGAGRFTEVLLAAGAKVISCDYSLAVDANADNNRGKGDLFLFQGDVYDLPVADNTFDFVFCYGVLQHTPDPVAAYQALFRKLRPGGQLTIDYYRKFSWPTPWSTPKYLWRPITTRMKPETLMRWVCWYVPKYQPVDTFIRRIPKLGWRLCAIIPIPCWNYLDFGLSEKQRREWAILDTYDALSPRYDQPKTLDEVRTMVTHAGAEAIEVFYGSNGVVANLTKQKS